MNPQTIVSVDLMSLQTDKRLWTMYTRGHEDHHWARETHDQPQKPLQYENERAAYARGWRDAGGQTAMNSSGVQIPVAVNGPPARAGSISPDVPVVVNGSPTRAVSISPDVPVSGNGPPAFVALNPTAVKIPASTMVQKVSNNGSSTSINVNRRMEMGPIRVGLAAPMARDPIPQTAIYHSLIGYQWVPYQPHSFPYQEQHPFVYQQSNSFGPYCVCYYCLNSMQ